MNRQSRHYEKVKRFGKARYTLWLLFSIALFFGITLPGGAVLAGEVYRIGPGDQLKITIWREEKLTRPILIVRPDGRISLPLVDDVQAGGLTPMELKQVITKALRTYLEEPQVYVEVKKAESRYFCVLGNVNTPGRFLMLTPTNVLQALAEAQGFNKWAKKDGIVIIRGTGEEQKRLPFEYSDVISGEKMNQNIILTSGDVVVVP